VTDDAKRIVDVVRLHQLAKSYGQYAIIRMVDGSSDGIAYPTYRDGVRSQPTFYRDLVFPIKVPIDELTPDMAQRILNYWRQCRDAGFRPPDPDDVPARGEPIVPDTIEALERFARGSRN
jgi:hypothetical protein